MAKTPSTWPPSGFLEINPLNGVPLTPAGIQLREQLARVNQGPDHSAAVQRLATFREIALGIAKSGLFDVDQKERLLEAAREVLVAAIKCLRSNPAAGKGGDQ